MTARASAPATRSILVRQRGGGDQIVEGIPAAAKITFGPLQPGSKDYGMRSEGNVLRIYTAANNQLAVFVGVESFRDLSLTVKTRKVSKNSSSKSVVGPDGASSASEHEEIYEWAEEKPF